MRKLVAPRFLLATVVYALVFILLVQFQFAKKTRFTRRTGNLVIQGNYGKAPADIPLSGTYPLEGGAAVFFGGMEFRLGDPGSFVLGRPGVSVPARLRSMTLADNGVYFQLEEGPELVFITQYTGGAVELLIRAEFTGPDETIPAGNAGEENGSEVREGYSFLEIPFRPLRTSQVRENGSSVMVNAGGANYTFDRISPSFTGGVPGEVFPVRMIRLETRNPAISYRAVPDRQSPGPEEYVIPAARDSAEYESAFGLWLDQAYLGWNRAASQASSLGEEFAAPPGKMISAYMNEALKRGTYKAAAAAVSSSYNPALSSYEASAYVNKLEGALRVFSAAEREKFARYARLCNEKSRDFFKEFRIIEYLGVRNYTSLMNDAAEMLRNFDPAEMSPEQTAGFLESDLDWKRYRPGRNNPYERFINQAVFVITGNLRKNSRNGHVLMFTGDTADTELNLRLGSALLEYQDEVKAALGRTLILSVLSLADNSGDVPLEVGFGGGGFAGKPGSRLDSARIYRILCAGKNYARAQALGAGVWAWTAASPVSASALPGSLDITVNFFPGETHYMLIRGIKPFTRLTINGFTVASDPQFERYDSSGWSYSAPEQTLLLKLRHRSAAEQISLKYE